MRSLTVLIVATLGVLPSLAAEKATTLTEQEIADGWISLFDGETTFGWKVEGDAKVENGVLIVGGAGRTVLTSTSRFGPGQCSMSRDVDSSSTATVELVDSKPTPIIITVPPGKVERYRSIRYRPTPLRPLFNGQDLTGWKLYDADPKNAMAKFEVTPAGELAVTGGPGDLQTEAKYDDFVLQARAKTRRPGMNSGIFFRCIEGQYQQGYEVQIQNSIKDNDRTKPLDYGTGAIYRRVPARKVVSTDGEWFTLTVIADGPHIATWVNGYQVVDWTDDRPRDPNPRKGLRTEAGHISIQGHGPPMTADIVFQSIKLAELKK